MDLSNYLDVLNNSRIEEQQWEQIKTLYFAGGENKDLAETIALGLGVDVAGNFETLHERLMKKLTLKERQLFECLIDGGQTVEKLFMMNRAMFYDSGHRNISKLLSKMTAKDILFRRKRGAYCINYPHVVGEQKKLF